MIMNLGKLLGAGKSFFGGGKAKAYRENKGVYLPKFNAEKNPFAPKPANIAADAGESKATPSSTPVATAKATAFPSAAPARPVRAASWKDKLNPFRAPEPAAPLMVGAVQTELSLDAVKVIRNDLSDADIEVVPVKSQTVSAAEPPILPPSRRSWNSLTERLVGAE
jgi:hypothetical protein